MKKICWEESFHILHGRDVILALVTGTDEQRELVQEALDRWWEPLMHVPRQPDPGRGGSDGRLADQEPGERGGAPAVPRRLRAADPGARARRSPTRAAQGRGDGVVGVHRARLGRAARGRHRARAGVGGAARVPAAVARGRRPGSSGSCSRRPRELVFEVFRQERKGQPFAARRLGDGARRDVRRDLRARAVRPAAGVGGALARAARRASTRSTSSPTSSR